MLNLDGNKLIENEKTQLSESMEEFSIWAKHTGNDDWIGYTKIRLDLFKKEKKVIVAEEFAEELSNLQNVIRKLGNL